MDDHVKMIRARRVAETARCATRHPKIADEKRGGSHGQIRHRAAFPLAGMGRRGKRLFPRRRPRLRIPRNDAAHRRQSSTISATRSAPIRPSRRAAPATSAAPAIGRSTSPPRRATASSMPTPIRSRPRACSCRRNSPIKEPNDLAGVPISVGYQSGSHYSTIQALEQYMPLADIKLTFADGLAVQPHGAALRPARRRRCRCSAAPIISSSSSASARSSTPPS